MGIFYPTPAIMSVMIDVLFIIGTRPEAIKMAPIIIEAEKHTLFNPLICVTQQHSEMLNQVLDFFKITPNYQLNIMEKHQTLSDITSKTITALQQLLKKISPKLVMIQGDTNTSFAGALAAFYHRIPIAHIEAGLRSFNTNMPYPEEANRCMISKLATYHFAPTKTAIKNLKRERIQTNVKLVGNTIIDALKIAQNTLHKNSPQLPFSFESISHKTIILLTCHRREHWGQPMKDVFSAVLTILTNNPMTHVVFPVHLNPTIQQLSDNYFKKHPQVTLLKPLSYPELIYVMTKSHIVLTDSGGIQEEAPSLNKPIIVLRSVTERTEGVIHGTAKLVGTNKTKIIESTQELLNKPKNYSKMTMASELYGDGQSAKRILNTLEQYMR